MLPARSSFRGGTTLFLQSRPHSQLVAAAQGYIESRRCWPRVSSLPPEPVLQATDATESQRVGVQIGSVHIDVEPSEPSTYAKGGLTQAVVLDRVSFRTADAVTDDLSASHRHSSSVGDATYISPGETWSDQCLGADLNRRPMD